jgi:hypothetical protein
MSNPQDQQAEAERNRLKRRAKDLADQTENRAEEVQDNVQNE